MFKNKNMDLKQKIILVLITISQCVGWVFLLTSAYFVIQYNIDTENPTKHEYLVGVYLGLLYGFSFMLGSTFLAIYIKKVIGSKWFKFIAIPTLVVGIVTFCLYFWSIAVGLLNKT